MEKYRIFERKCIRACINKYRKPMDNYKYYYSNKTIYREAKIGRIDNFIIKNIRFYFNNINEVKENSLICNMYYPNDAYFESAMNKGFIPPEAFVYLDINNLIQNEYSVPIVYHIYRAATNTSIQHNSYNINERNYRYDMNTPELDVLKRKSYINKICWLNN